MHGRSVVTKWFSAERMAGVALAVSLLALALSTVDIVETRRANRIAVRPILSASFGYNEAGAGWRLTNKGLGPGSMKWFEVLLDGLPVHTWTELVTKIGLPANQQFDFIIPRGTYTADADIPLLWVAPLDVTARDILMKNSGRVRMTYCFCSMQDECWIRQGPLAPIPVDDCEDNSRPSIHLHREPEGETHNQRSQPDRNN
jgi:hypothetical protein